MTPDQARRAAEKLRLRFEPPTPSQSPGRYTVTTAVHALADALDEIADEDESTSTQ